MTSAKRNAASCKAMKKNPSSEIAVVPPRMNDIQLTVLTVHSACVCVHACNLFTIKNKNFITFFTTTSLHESIPAATDSENIKNNKLNFSF